MSSVYCRMAPGDPLHGLYHDTEYGFPTDDESVLFERLMLEINQAGLSWATILRKRAAFRAAFADFAVDSVAAFGPAETDRLLADPGYLPGAHEPDCPVYARIRELRPPWSWAAKPAPAPD